MKKCLALALILALLTCVFSCAIAEKTDAELYKERIDEGAPWKRTDYNCVYQKSAQSVLPEYFTYYCTSITKGSYTVFGDETDEVWIILDSLAYRVWFTTDGDLVLTNTSDGLGYTGYAVFTSSSTKQ